MTQADMVLAHMKENGGITSWEAIQIYGCTRLSAAIYDLRKAGWAIDSEPVRVKDRYGKPTVFARYFFAGRSAKAIREEKEMKTPEKTKQFHEIGEKLQGLISTALPDSEVSVRYDESVEYFFVTTYGREHAVSVAYDSPAGALKDIGAQLLSKKL